jgi:MATE family multidrug resistance protein
MGTTSIISRALGENNQNKIFENLIRNFFLSIIIGILIFFFKDLIFLIQASIFNPDEVLAVKIKTYFDIRIYSSPFVLINFCILGYLVGISSGKKILLFQMILNLSNILISYVLVIILDMGIKGVAFGTLCSEIIATIFGVLLIKFSIPKKKYTLKWEKIFSVDEIIEVFSFNLDLFIRTICLLIIFLTITKKSGQISETVLAANTILIHFITFSAYLLDSYAHSIEGKIGRSIGAKNKFEFQEYFISGAILNTTSAVVISGVLILFGFNLIELFTENIQIISMAQNYYYWAALAPLVGSFCFFLDGVFIGCGYSKAMRNSMLITFFIFFFSFIFLDSYGNTGVWLSLYLSYILRFFTLIYLLKGKIKKEFISRYKT